MSLVVDNVVFFDPHKKQLGEGYQPAPRVPIARVKKIAKTLDKIIQLIGMDHPVEEEDEEEEIESLFKEEEEEEKRPRESDDYMDKIHAERKKVKIEQKQNRKRKDSKLPPPEEKETIGKKQLLNPTLVSYADEMIALAKQGMLYKTAPWLTDAVKHDDVPKNVDSMPTYVADVMSALDHFVCWQEVQQARKGKK